MINMPWVIIGVCTLISMFGRMWHAIVCMSENNVPVVGRKEVSRHHEIDMVAY